MEEETVESASVTLRRMLKGSHEIVVDNYSQICEKLGHDFGRSMVSAKFIVGGYQWRVVIYPYGEERDDFESGHASLFVNLKSETTSPVRCLYELSILNQSGEGNHWSRSLFVCRPSQGVRSLRYNSISGYPRFIKRALLESDYLKDDCLKIRATIGVLTSEIRAQPLVKIPESNIGADFGKLLESKLGADVFFRVAGEIFCAHKSILAARFPVFRSRFSDAYHQHQEILITDIQPRIFKAMLWFIYTGSLPVDEQEGLGDFSPFIFESFMVKMLAAADRFELKKLKKICESSIMEEVSVESVAYLLHLACLYNATELKASCLRCIAENQDAVMESEGLEYLKENCPALFLDLVGCKGNPFTCRVGEFDIGSKILTVVKNSVVSMFWPQYSSDMMRERKDL